jgi:hypothetical protein
MEITKNLGMLFLAIYLIIVGLSSLITIASLFALVAGILILVGR